MSVRFAFDIIDRMSGPANKINGTLDRMSKALAKADSATAMTKGEKALGRLKTTLEKANFGVRVAFGDKAADTLDRFTKGELKVADKAEIARKGLSMVSGAATVAAGALVAAGAAAGGFAVAGGKLLLDAQKFKEDTAFALQFALGSSEAAAEAMGEVQRVARVLGTNTEGAMAKFRELNSKGFDSKESEILLQFAADLKAMNNGQEVAIDKIADPIKALKKGESLNVGSFAALQDASMSRAKLNDSLAKSLKVNVAGLNEDQATAKINAALAQIPRGQKALDAMFQLAMDAMNEKALGQKAKEYQDSTITGSIDKIKNRWDDLLKSVNSTEAGKSLVKNLQGIAEFLNPTKESGRQIVAILDRMASGASSFITTIKPLGQGFGEGFSKAVGEVGMFLDILGKGQGSTQAFASGLKTIGVAAAEFIVGAALVVGAVGWLVGTIIEAVVTLPDNFRYIGRWMIEGLGEGIDSAKAWLVGKLEALAALLPESVRKLLQIRSPSRVMMRLGEHTAEGLAEGVERGAPRVEESAREMTSAVTRQGAQASGGGGGQRTAIFQEGAVQIVVPATGASPEEMLRLVKEALAQALREIGFETGAATLWAYLSFSPTAAPRTSTRASSPTGTSPFSTATRSPGS